MTMGLMNTQIFIIEEYFFKGLNIKEQPSQSPMNLFSILMKSSVSERKYHSTTHRRQWEKIYIKITNQ
jgi:hypothetical protein